MMNNQLVHIDAVGEYAWGFVGGTPCAWNIRNGVSSPALTPSYSIVANANDTGFIGTMINWQMFDSRVVAVGYSSSGWYAFQRSDRLDRDDIIGRIPDFVQMPEAIKGTVIDHPERDDVPTESP